VEVAQVVKRVLNVVDLREQMEIKEERQAWKEVFVVSELVL